MFKKYFPNSYGFDRLSWLSLIFSVYFLFEWYALPFGIALIAWSLFRALSNNKSRRGAELYKYNMIMLKISGFLIKTFTPIFRKISNFFKRIKQRKYYKFTKCPSCTKRLRLPKGKGRIMVTCPDCMEKFSLNT